jgi:predicted  nucleic acid-binding Zn-ribbon protein
MSDEIKPPSVEELLKMLTTFSEHISDLEQEIAVEREKNVMLNTENSGWLKIYQRLLSEIGALKSDISRLQSQIQGSQSES